MINHRLHWNDRSGKDQEIQSFLYFRLPFLNYEADFYQTTTYLSPEERRTKEYCLIYRYITGIDKEFCNDAQVGSMNILVWSRFARKGGDFFVVFCFFGNVMINKKVL